MKLAEVQVNRKARGQGYVLDRSEGAMLKPVKGLHDARPGDIIKIGVEGTRQKVTVKIAKVVANDRLQDTDGNIFDRSGRVFRKKGFFLKHLAPKGKIVFAKHVTQKELDDELVEKKIEYLNKQDWKKVSLEKREAVLKILNVQFSTMQGAKR